MALRFQTRLTLVLTLLLTFSIVLLIIMSVWTITSSLLQIDQTHGRTTNRLATTTLSYSTGISNTVETLITDQMVVSAFLAAELVDVAENEAGLKPEEIEARLERVIERAAEYQGHAMAEEFWISGEDGHAYINTEDADFSFSPDPAKQPQASEFWKLLTPGAEPVVQSMTNREIDRKPYVYVGVSGVDKPRIVQIGVSQDLVHEMRQSFDIEQIVDQFQRELDVRHIVLVDRNGEIVAGNWEAEEGRQWVKNEALSLCAGFLNGDSSFELTAFGRDICVVTRLSGPDQSSDLALCMLYNTQAGMEVVRKNTFYILSIGLVTLAIALAASFAMSRRFSKPIGELAEGVRHFGQGNFSHRVHLRTDDEIQGLAEAFNQMAGSIQDYTRELEVETMRRERLESELRIAAELQRSLLPETSPQREGLEVIGWSRPAREVGGDFFDYLDLDEERLGVVIGDATGKGLPAALLINECWSTFTALASNHIAASELLERTNRALCKRMTGSCRFVTLFFLVIDCRRHTITYSSGGHHPPFLIHKNDHTTTKLDQTRGFPLGLFPDATYQEVTIPFEVDDTIFLYSDGLTEAHNPGNELYGEERMVEVLTSEAECPLNALLLRLDEDVQRHMAGRENFDDMTLVALRMHPHAAPSGDTA